MRDNNDIFQNRYHDINKNPDENAPGTMGCFDKQAMAQRTDRYGLGASVSAAFSNVEFDRNEVRLDKYQSSDSEIMKSLQEETLEHPFINSYNRTSPSQEQLSRVLKDFTGQEVLRVPEIESLQHVLGEETTWAKIAQHAILGELSPEQVVQLLDNKQLEPDDPNKSESPQDNYRERYYIKYNAEYNRQLQLAETRMKAIGEALSFDPPKMATVYKVLNSIQDETEGKLIRDAFTKLLVEKGEKEQTFDDYIKDKLEAHFRKKENIKNDSELPKNTQDHINKTVAMLNGFDPAKATKQLTEALSQLPSEYYRSEETSWASTATGIAIAAMYCGNKSNSILKSVAAGYLGSSVVGKIMQNWQGAGDDTWYREVQRCTAGLSEEQKNQIREHYREHYEGLDLISEGLQTEIEQSLDAMKTQTTVDKESIHKIAQETLDKLQDKQEGEILTPEQKQKMILELALKLQSNAKVIVEGTEASDRSAQKVFKDKMKELLEEQHKRDQAEWAKLAEKEREEWKKTNPEPTLVEFHSLVAEKIGPGYSSSDVTNMFTETFDPDAFAALIMSETALRTRALAQIETAIGEIDSDKVKKANERLGQIQKEKEKELTDEDKENPYLQRAILLEEVKNLPNVILGAHEKAHFSEISLSEDQIEEIKKSLTHQLKTHRDIPTNLDFTIDDRVRPQTIYDKERTPRIPIAIVTEWKDTHRTPVGSELRDSKRSKELYSDTLP